MNPFSEEDLQNLGDLSALSLSEEEKATFSKDLEKILDYIEQLKEVDTESVKPCDHVLEDMVMPFREDRVVNDDLDSESFMNNAPSHVGRFIKVPSVLNPSSES